MKHLWITISFAWAAYAASPCSQSGVLFCNGFEGVRQEVADAWGAPSVGFFLAKDPGPFNIAGNQVLKLSAGGGGAEIKKKLPTKHDRLYARWYQKWDAGYDWSKADHQGLLLASGENTAGAAYYPDGCNETTRMLLESTGGGTGGGSFHWYVYQPGKNLDPDPNKWNPWGVVYGTGAPVTSNRWYCVEAMVDLGTPTQTISGANGSMELWVDGQSYGRKSGLWFRTCDSLKLWIIDIMTYARADWVQPGISISYDDIVVSTQPIGIGTRVDYTRNTLGITTPAIPAAKKDSAYATWINGIGGIKPYLWSISSGALPQGLTMSNVAGSLNIKGTSMVSGVFPFTVQLKDSGTGQTATRTFTLNVTPLAGSSVRAGSPKVLAHAEGMIQSGRLVFRLPANSAAGIVRVHDAMGHVIWKQGTTKKSLLVESPVFSNGLYVAIFQNSRESITFRFAVVR